VLARACVLDGLRATTHWRAAEELARRHPKTEVDADVLYVENGRVLTSAGAAAGMDLCLYIERRDRGASVAARVAKAAAMPLERFAGQAQFIEHKAPECGESIGPLLLWMERNLRQNLSLSIIARHARMSTRTLSAEVSFAYMWSADQILGPAGHWHPHMMVYVPNYDNSMLGNNDAGSDLPGIGDDAGTSFAVGTIPVDDKLAIRVRP
jgi:hypothetical protein